MPSVLKGVELGVVFGWGTVESHLMKSTFFSPGTRAQSVRVCKHVTSSLCNGERAGVVGGVWALHRMDGHVSQNGCVHRKGTPFLQRTSRKKWGTVENKVRKMKVENCSFLSDSAHKRNKVVNVI